MLKPDREPAYGLGVRLVGDTVGHGRRMTLYNLAYLVRAAAVTALTLAELAAGPHATDDATERARRQERLQRAEAAFDPLPFDDQAARAYGRIYAATRASARKPRDARAVDLLIAAVALANDLPLFTRNATDFQHLDATGLQIHPI